MFLFVWNLDLLFSLVQVPDYDLCFLGVTSGFAEALCVGVSVCVFQVGSCMTSLQQASDLFIRLKNNGESSCYQMHI